MGNVGTAQLRQLLEQLRKGTISFESYLDTLGADAPEFQVQVRAAFEQSKAEGWSQDEYQAVRLVLAEEFDLTWDQTHRAEVKAFNPFAEQVKTSVLPEGWTWDPETGKAQRKDGDTSHILAAVTAAAGARASKDRKQASTDPLRKVSGQFLGNVAELWFYDPETGLLNRQTFTGGKDPIARAFGRAQEIQLAWNLLDHDCGPCVWVKFRVSDKVTLTHHDIHGKVERLPESIEVEAECKGPRHVKLVDARGMVAFPSDVTRLAGQARGLGIRSKVGERLAKTKLANIKLMLANNPGGDLDMRKVRTWVDWGSIEQEDKNEIVYSIQYQSFWSGNKNGRVSVVARPLSDDKDDDGNVIMAGHRKRAFRLLLDAACGKADSARTVKYMSDDGVTHIVSRKQALEWASDDEAEDEILVALWEQFHNGEIEDDEYFAKRGNRLEQLDPQRSGRLGGYQTMNRTNDRLGWWSGMTHPDGTETPGRWDWKGRRVEYNSEGRVYWGNVKTRGWTGAMPDNVSYHEAQAWSYQDER